MGFHENITRKMLDTLKNEELVVEDSESNKYLVFNEIKIDTDGCKIILKKDGEDISEIPTSKINPGDTVTLTDMIGFVKFSIK